MKVFIFLLLVMLPLAMGAGHSDFEEMEEMLEKEAKHRGWTSEGHDSKEGEDDSSEEDCDDEEEMRKMMKELGQEMAEWRGKMAEFMKRSAGKGHDGDDDHDHDSGEKKHDNDKHDPEKDKKRMKLYKEFHEFLEYKEHEKEAKAKKTEEFKKEVNQFKDYMKLKGLQREEERKKEMMQEREREYEETSYMMRQKYMNLSHEYMQARFNFTFSITNQVLDICQCDDRKGLMMRLRDGDFGRRDMDDHDGNQTTHSTQFPGSSTYSPGGSSPSFTPSPWPGSRSTSFPDSSHSPGNGSDSSPLPPGSSHSPGNGSDSSPAPPGSSPSPGGIGFNRPSPPPVSSSSPGNGSNRSLPPPGASSSPGHANRSGSSPPPHSSMPPNHHSNGSSPYPTGSPFPTGSTPFPSSTRAPDDDGDDGRSRDEIMEIVRRFAGMKPEEQFRTAFDQLTKNLCESAGVYMEHVMDVEKAVAEYMKMYYEYSHNVRHR